MAKTKKPKKARKATGTTITPKEKLFVQEYLIDYNGARAAREAGYSPDCARQIATSLLSKVYVQQAVYKATEARTDRLLISQDRIVQELMKIGFADIMDYADEAGNINFEEIDSAISPAISEVIETTFKDRDGCIKTTKKIRLYDKQKALTDLAKHMGLLKDKSEAIVTHVHADIDKKELKKLTKQLLEKDDI